jgi:hypothetical protein
MKTRTALFVLVALSLALLAGSNPAGAELGGSKVTFDGTVEGGAACYIPGRTNTLCFQLDTYTDDGEDVAAAFIKFPSDWTPAAGPGGILSPVGTPSCDNGGAFSGEARFSSTGAEHLVNHLREQNAPDHCNATFCFQVLTGTTTTANASLSWSWIGREANSETGAPPHHPCSNDGYADPTGLACDETINPPTTVPVCTFVPLTVQPETLPDAHVGVPYSQQISVDGGSGPYSWGRRGTLPDGIEFGLLGSGAAIGGVATTPGTYRFTILVSGSGWSEGSREYALVVSPPPENHAPTVTCPAALTPEATGPDGANATIQVAVDDLDSDPLAATWYVDDMANPVDTHYLAAGSTSDGLTQLLGLGSHTVRVSVSDDKADPVSCDTTVAVQDTTPPTIGANDDVTAEATSAAGANVSYTSPATHDLVDGDGTAACLPASGSPFALGDTTVTCNATDAHNNHAAPTTFVVHVVAAASPSQLTPSSATCKQFQAGTAADLSQLLYTVNRYRLISAVTPNTFAYMVKVNAPNANAFNVLIAQSNGSRFPAMMPATCLVTLYDGNCTRLSSRSATVKTESGRNVRINFAAGAGGRTIYVMVKYPAISVYGRMVNKPYPTVSYTFSAAVGANSPFTQDSLVLKPQ